MPSSKLYEWTMPCLRFAAWQATRWRRLRPGRVASPREIPMGLHINVIYVSCNMYIYIYIYICVRESSYYRFIHSFIYSFTCLFICLYMCFDYSVMFFIYSFRDLSIHPCAHRCILYISKRMWVYAYEHVLSYCIIITIFCLGMYWLQPWGLFSL